MQCSWAGPGRKGSQRRTAHRQNSSLLPPGHRSGLPTQQQGLKGRPVECIRLQASPRVSCEGHTVSWSPLPLRSRVLRRAAVDAGAAVARCLVAAEVRIALCFERLLRHVNYRLTAWQRAAASARVDISMCDRTRVTLGVSVRTPQHTRAEY